MTERKGFVELLSLDGPREREFNLPDNWDEMTPEEQQAIYYPVKLQLMEDAVDWTWSVDGED